MKKISVIIPVYKVEAYLERCVASVVRQTHSNLEIILVDDGSPDRCGQICDELALQDSRIRVIHKKNGGLSDARNAGIDAATGDYIAFLDSDDWIDPAMLQILYRLCEENDAGIAECNYRNIYHDRTEINNGCTSAVMTFTPIQAIENCLDSKYCSVVVWNKLYRADVIGDIRFPVGKLHEDEFTTHLYFLAAEKILYVDVALMNYERRNLGSITSSFKPKNMEACEAFRAKTHLVWERPELSSIDKKMCDNYCYILVDRIRKCEEAYPDCQELKDTIRNAYEDFEALKQHGTDHGYVQILNDVFRKYERILTQEVVCR